jgi:dTDP-4-amino-4,6-dideoxy-D-galactose acyltransferase
MESALAPPAPRRVKPLTWDSAEFGFAVGELTTDQRAGEATEGGLSSEEYDALVTARNDGLRLVYLKSPELPPRGLARLVEAAALVGIYADDRVVFEKHLTGRKASPTPEGVRLSSYPVGPPSPGLVTLGLQAGEHSRFRRDPRFTEAAFVRLYSEWVRRSALREVCSEVLVAETAARGSAEPAGFLTLSMERDEASIGLIAVSPIARNSGIGTALMRGAETLAYQAGCRIVRVMTQHSNDAACRLYERAGYTLAQRSFIYHLWLT